MVLKVYSFRVSAPCRSVLLFLQTTGIEFEEVNIDLTKGENRAPTYEKTNPMKSVPAINDDGFILTESVAIMKYLAEKHKVPDHWYPKDLNERARVDEYMAFHHSNIRKDFVRVFADNFILPVFSHTYPPKDEIKKNIETLRKTATSIQDIFLQDNKYLCGDEISIADLLALEEMLQTTPVNVDCFADRPKLAAWRDRVKEKMGLKFDEIKKPLDDLKHIPLPKRP